MRCEFFGRFWLLDPSSKDASGRPLLEGKLPAVCGHHVEITRASCPYHDGRSRSGLPMNASALRAVAHDWNEVLGYVLALRRSVTQEADTSLLLKDALAVVSMATSMASLHTRKHPENVPVPCALASLYKVNVGAVGALIAFVLAKWAEGLDTDRSFPAEEIGAFIERNDLLIGTHEVCAGPPALIDSLLASIVYGVVPTRIACTRITRDDEVSIARYADTLLRMEWLKRAFLMQHAMLIERANAMLGGLGCFGEWRKWLEKRKEWQHTMDSYAIMLEGLLFGLPTHCRNLICDRMQRAVDPSGGYRMLPVAPPAEDSIKNVALDCATLLSATALKATRLQSGIDALPGAQALRTPPIRPEALETVFGPCCGEFLGQHLAEHLV